MFGDTRKLMTIRCVVCGKHVAMRVDPEDIARHRAGVFVHVAFAGRDGVPYLDDSERELWLSGCCGSCWELLCPSDRLAYS